MLCHYIQSYVVASALKVSSINEEIEKFFNLCCSRGSFGILFEGTERENEMQQMSLGT